VAAVLTSGERAVNDSLGICSALQQRNVTYLHHAATSGEHPRLAQLLSQAPVTAGPADSGDPADRYRRILARILAGLLGPAPGSA
jgi:hypothetical protein